MVNHVLHSLDLLLFFTKSNLANHVGGKAYKPTSDALGRQGVPLTQIAVLRPQRRDAVVFSSSESGTTIAAAAATATAAAETADSPQAQHPCTDC